MFTQVKFGFGSFKAAYIVSASRTPIASFVGKLSKLKASELGGAAIKGALSKVKVPVEAIDEVILGNVCQAGQGQAPARQAALAGGLLSSTPCTTVNKVCASGIKTVAYAAQSIALGQSQCVVAGGFESMSNVPFYIMNHRKGFQFGNDKLIDGLAYDGLTDVYNNIAMGLCAEKTVRDFKLTRQLQDDYSITSYERTQNSIKTGKFAEEYTPVKIGKEENFTQDEEILRYKREKIPLLKAVFSKDGTITAGNASKINDAGCAIIVCSEDKIKELNLKPLARIVSYADAEVDPIDFCIAPSKACTKALQRAGMKMNQIEYHEINEAFAITVLANMKLLDLSVDRVNVNGGAIALGHPVGMSGARLVQSLITVLKQNKAKFGMASLCNGGGGATAMIIENLN